MDRGKRMNIITALKTIELLTYGITSALQVMKEIKNNTDSTKESKEMLTARIDKIQKEVEDYFKELK